MSKIVAGLFENQEYAEAAARKIKELGLRTDDISIVAKRGETGDPNDKAAADSVHGAGEMRGNSWIADTQTGTNDNISDGVISGGVLGGVAGLLLGAGSMVIPGLGIIAAAGPIAGLLSGAVTGGVVGGLIDLGIPESKSRQYENDIRQGKVLFSMKTDEDKVDMVSSVLRNNGASNVNVH